MGVAEHERLVVGDLLADRVVVRALTRAKQEDDDGTAMTAIQAPSANFETATTTSVIPVATAPTPLIHIDRRRPAPPRRAPVLHHPRLRRA